LIIFNSSGSDEECTEEVEPNEPDGELQIITECWIEPQYGHIIESPPERAYMDGLSYDQLADEVGFFYFIPIFKFIL